MTVEVLSPSAVVVGATAGDRKKAIALVGSILIAEGCVTSEYVTQMQEREEIVSTYLGNGTILGDEDLCRRLGSTLDAAEIHRALTAPEADAPSGNGHPARSDEIARELKITNPHGLHARPAATVVDRVRPFGAEVVIHANGRKANARSITALLGLGAAMGDEVRIVARGADAQSATDAVAAILTSTTEG